MAHWRMWMREALTDGALQQTLLPLQSSVALWAQVTRVEHFHFWCAWLCCSCAPAVQLSLIIPMENTTKQGCEIPLEIQNSINFLKVVPYAASARGVSPWHFKMEAFKGWTLSTLA